VPPLFTAVVSVILFFHPQPFLHLARLATRQILGGL
jgi:hypothetical protein